MGDGFKEQRIRKITSLYYSRPEIQKAIHNFSKNREVVPRYFEGFGKRPDMIEYPGDVFELVKKGATSFHCSQELWKDPLKIETGMNEKQMNELRTGWDFLIDIDCKWFDYSKLAARAIVDTLKKYGVKNIGIKFSGSKGWHIIVPRKSFPKEIAGEDTKNLFPDLPRKLMSFLRFESEEQLKKILPDDFYNQFKDAKIKRGIKCNTCKNIADKYFLINYLCRKCRRQEFRKFRDDSPDKKKKYKCPDCRGEFEIKDSKESYICSSCKISSIDNPSNFSRTVEVDLFDLMGLDLVLVSPRHLFRTPYSLHEKTALSSRVIPESELDNFDMKFADPSKIQEGNMLNFLPSSKESEAEEFVREALDWVKENQIRVGVPNEELKGKYSDFKPIKLVNLLDEHFSPSIRKILEGVGDGRKRALFVILNFFRSVGIDKDELEKKIFEWNKKNEVPLKEGYVTTQILWSYRKKPILPPNFSTDYYKGIGVIPTDEEMRFKNPVNYTIKMNMLGNKNTKVKSSKARKKTDS